MAGDLAHVEISLGLKKGSVRDVESQVAAAVSRIEKLAAGGSLLSKSYTQPLGRISGSVDEFTKSLEASNARVIAFGASAGAIFLVQKALQETVLAAVDVEKKLQDINVILNLNGSSLQKFGQALFDIAKNTGQSFDEVSRSALEFSRQGLSVEQTLKRTRDALILSRLSGLDVVDSTESITAALNTFNKTALDSTTLINKLANVDAAFAVSSKDLAEAIKRVGSSAGDAGVGLDELIAVITSVQQTTARGGSVIGNSLKTIFTRIQRPEVLSDLEAFGVAVKDASDNSLSAIDVLKNFASVYETLSPAQKSLTSELLGGVFQINILKAAVGDLGKGYSVYERALETSLASTDQAILRNEDLNKTLSALFKETSNNAKSFAASFGKGAFEPALKGVLGFTNDVFDAISEKDPEDIGSNIGKGVVDGIGKYLSTSGLAIIGFIGAKLLTNFSKFSVDAVSSFVGLNSEAKRQQEVQQLIQNILIRNPELINAAASSSHGLLSVEQKILDVVQQRNTVLEQSSRISKKIASGVTPAVLKSFSKESLPTGGYAGGFVPNYNQQHASSEIMGAVLGGYTPGRVVKSPVGGVMNTAEEVKYVPGFAQPFINPPANSKAGREHKNNSMRKTGVNPYSSEGFIPNFFSPSIYIADEPYNIKDGDTVTANATIKNIKDFRLEGIDAVEKDQGESLNAQAVALVNKRFSKAQDFRSAINKQGKAAYDRLSFISEGLSKDLVRQGLGVPDVRYSKDKVYRDLTEKAKNDEKGVWGYQSRGKYTHPKAIQYLAQTKIEGKEYKDKRQKGFELYEAAKSGRDKFEALYGGFIPNFAGVSFPFSSIKKAKRRTKAELQAERDRVVSGLGGKKPEAYIFPANYSEAELAKMDAATSEDERVRIRGGFYEQQLFNGGLKSLGFSNIEDLNKRFHGSYRADFFATKGGPFVIDAKAGSTDSSEKSIMHKLSSFTELFKEKKFIDYISEKGLNVSDLNTAIVFGVTPSKDRIQNLNAEPGQPSLFANKLPGDYRYDKKPEPTEQDKINHEKWLERQGVYGRERQKARIQKDREEKRAAKMALASSGFVPNFAPITGGTFYDFDDTITLYPPDIDRRTLFGPESIAHAYLSPRGHDLTRSSEPINVLTARETNSKAAIENFLKHPKDKKGNTTRPIPFNEVITSGDFYKGEKVPGAKAGTFRAISSAEKKARYLSQFPQAHLVDDAQDNIDAILGLNNPNITAELYRTKGQHGINQKAPGKKSMSVRDIRNAGLVSKFGGFVPNFSPVTLLRGATTKGISPEDLFKRRNPRLDKDLDPLRENFSMEALTEYLNRHYRAPAKSSELVSTTTDPKVAKKFATDYYDRVGSIGTMKMEGSRILTKEKVQKLIKRFGEARIGKIFQSLSFGEGERRKNNKGLGFDVDSFLDPSARRFKPEFEKAISGIPSSATYGYDEDYSRRQMLEAFAEKAHKAYLSKQAAGFVPNFAQLLINRGLSKLPYNHDMMKGSILTQSGVFGGVSPNAQSREEIIKQVEAAAGRLLTTGELRYLNHPATTMEMLQSLSIKRKLESFLNSEERSGFAQIPFYSKGFIPNFLPVYRGVGGTRIAKQERLTGKSLTKDQINDIIFSSRGSIHDSYLFKDDNFSISSLAETLRLHQAQSGDAKDFISTSISKKVAKEFAVETGTGVARVGEKDIPDNRIYTKEKINKFIERFGKERIGRAINSSIGGKKDVAFDVSSFSPNSDLNREKEIAIAGKPKNPDAPLDLFFKNKKDKSQNLDVLEGYFGAQLGGSISFNKSKKQIDIKSANILGGKKEAAAFYEKLASAGTKISGPFRNKSFDFNKPEDRFPDLARAEIAKKAVIRMTEEETNKVLKLSLSQFKKLQKQHENDPGYFWRYGDMSLETTHSNGFIPNFSKHALHDAIKRESAAGIPMKDIKVGSDKSLVSSRNPSGLGVFNTLQEKNLRQGIGFAKQAGINPKTKGASEGFIPNFADGGVDSIDLASITLLISALGGSIGGFKASVDQLRGVQSQEVKDKIKNIESQREAISKERKILQDKIKLKQDEVKNVNPTDPNAKRAAEIEVNELKLKRTQLGETSLGLRRESADLDSRPAFLGRGGRATRFFGSGAAFSAGFATQQVGSIAQQFIPTGSVGGKQASAGIEAATGGASTALTFGAIGTAIAPGIGTAIGVAAGVLVGAADGAKKFANAELDQRIEELSLASQKANEKLTAFSAGTQGYISGLESLGSALSSETIKPDDVSRIRKQIGESLVQIPAEFRNKIREAGGDVLKIRDTFNEISSNLERQKLATDQSAALLTILKEGRALLRSESNEDIFDKSFFGVSKSQAKQAETGFSSLLKGTFDKKKIAEAIENGKLDEVLPENVFSAKNQKALIESAKKFFPAETIGLIESIPDTANNFKFLSEVLTKISKDARESAPQLRESFNIANQVAESNKRFNLSIRDLKRGLDDASTSLSTVFESIKVGLFALQEARNARVAQDLTLAGTRARGGIDAARPFLSEEVSLDLQSQVSEFDLKQKSINDINQALSNSQRSVLDIFTKNFEKSAQETTNAVTDLSNDAQNKQLSADFQKNLEITKKFGPIVSAALQKFGEGTIGEEKTQEEIVGLLKNAGLRDGKALSLSAQMIREAKLIGEKTAAELATIKRNEEYALEVQKIQTEYQRKGLELQKQISSFGGTQDFLSGKGQFGASQNLDRLIAINEGILSSLSNRGASAKIDFGRFAAQFSDFAFNNLNIDRSKENVKSFAPLIAASVQGRVLDIESQFSAFTESLRILNPDAEIPTIDAQDIALKQIAAQLKLEQLPKDVSALLIEAKIANTIAGTLQERMKKDNEEAFRSPLFESINGLSKNSATQLGTLSSNVTGSITSGIGSLLTPLNKLVELQSKIARETELKGLSQKVLELSDPKGKASELEDTVKRLTILNAPPISQKDKDAASEEARNNLRGRVGAGKFNIFDVEKEVETIRFNKLRDSLLASREESIKEGVLKPSPAQNLLFHERIASIAGESKESEKFNREAAEARLRKTKYGDKAIVPTQEIKEEVSRKKAERLTNLFLEEPRSSDKALLSAFKEAKEAVGLIKPNVTDPTNDKKISDYISLAKKGGVSEGNIKPFIDFFASMGRQLEGIFSPIEDQFKGVQSEIKFGSELKSADAGRANAPQQTVQDIEALRKQLTEEEKRRTDALYNDLRLLIEQKDIYSQEAGNSDKIRQLKEGISEHYRSAALIEISDSLKKISTDALNFKTNAEQLLGSLSGIDFRGFSAPEIELKRDIGNFSEQLQKEIKDQMDDNFEPLSSVNHGKIFDSAFSSFLTSDMSRQEQLELARLPIEQMRERHWSLMNLSNDELSRLKNEIEKGRNLTSEQALAKGISTRRKSLEFSLRGADIEVKYIAGLFEKGLASTEELQAAVQKRAALRAKDKTYKPSDFFDTLSSEFTYNTENALNDINSAGKEFSSSFRTGITSAFSEGIRGTKSLKQAFSDVFGDIAQMVQNRVLQIGVNALLGSLFGAGGAFGSSLGGVFTANSGGQVKGYSAGGTVTGGSGIRDDVPAYLTKGEFVLRKSAVNKYGLDFLGSLNNQTVKTRASGGILQAEGGRDLLVPEVEKSVLAKVQEADLKMVDPNKLKSSYSDIREDYAKFSLKNSYLYDDLKRPTRGEYSIDKILSAYALTTETNPQNELKFQSADNLDQYLREKADYEEYKAKALAEFKKQQKRSSLGAVFQTAIGLGAYGLSKTIKRATGGSIYQDNVPALLTGGEYVIKKAAVDQYGLSFFNRLNNGSLKGYADGGLVGGAGSVGGERASEFGASNNINIVINIDNGGNVTSNSTNAGGLTEQDGRLLADKINSSILTTLIQQKKPGGLLYQGS